MRGHSREWVAQAQSLSQPLQENADLDALVARLGGSRVVMLGEASHGTSEYYRWRFRLSKRLIEEQGFSFIAVEGDWPDCFHLNRYIKGQLAGVGRASQVLQAFARWPTWMWGNWEIVQLAEWLKTHNRQAERPVGFYGLDVYSLWESQAAVVQFLDEADPELARQARRAYACFEPYRESADDYAYATLALGASCEEAVQVVLRRLEARLPQLEDGEAPWSAWQNALVVKEAEHYYRCMIQGGPDAWNVRDRHMLATLERLLDLLGPEAKAIVWAHNTHIGDARYTSMAGAGEVNIGQLARERGLDPLLVGFGSYQGSVIAAYAWGDPMRRMTVPAARPGSVDALLHEAGLSSHWLWLGDVANHEPLAQVRDQRAIGVVYNPAYERFGNYVPTCLARRYDAYLYLDQTEALHPLRLYARKAHEPPETYPWAV